jgi:radical SAM superfamily enzyme YgiQ (UPF0313 family)
MKIGLVFPRMKYPSGDTPLGILYVATYLRSHGHDVDVIDTTFLADRNDVVPKLKAGYGILGFSTMTTMLKDALWIAKQAKLLNPNTRIVFGGPHPTVMPDHALKNEHVDAVAIGEGEATWLDLANRHGNFKGIKGIWYKHNGKTVKNPPRPLIKDLDSLPFPDQELVDLDQYFAHWFQLDSVARDLRGINIISSRGCPYNCSFCQPTLFKLFGRSIRRRSPQNIIDELSHWKERQNINAFMFQDDTLIFDKKWVEEFCDLLVLSKLDLVWGCNVRANLVDRRTFEMMHAAGLRKVFMGIESGSQRILDEVYQKGITIQQVRDSVKVFRSLGLKSQGYFMLGAPTETLDEVRSTISLARGLDIDEATFSVTTPLPETHLYDKTKELICEDIANFDYYKNPVYGSDTIPREELMRLKKQALLAFYLSPKRLFHTARAFASPGALRKSLVKLKRF